MIELPREVIATAALGMSQHYEKCSRGEDGGCATCKDVYVSADYAVQLVLSRHTDAVVAAIERHRAATP